MEPIKLRSVSAARAGHMRRTRPVCYAMLYSTILCIVRTPHLQQSRGGRRRTCRLPHGPHAMPSRTRGDRRRHACLGGGMGGKGGRQRMLSPTCLRRVPAPDPAPRPRALTPTPNPNPNPTLTPTPTPTPHPVRISCRSRADLAHLRHPRRSASLWPRRARLAAATAETAPVAAAAAAACTAPSAPAPAPAPPAPPHPPAPAVGRASVQPPGQRPSAVTSPLAATAVAAPRRRPPPTPSPPRWAHPPAAPRRDRVARPG
jgi:hypothetical protein